MESTAEDQSPSESEQTPKRSPSLKIAVNPLNAMANSIAEAFKKRSPTTGSRASFVVASSNGSGVETCLKYTPLTFDDDEQLPICSGAASAGAANLNTNNNNSSASESLAENGGVTTYGTAANQGALRGSGRSGGFGDRIKYKSPFSVLVVCGGVLIVFFIILGLSAIGKKTKAGKAHHIPHHVIKSAPKRQTAAQVLRKI